MVSFVTVLTFTMFLLLVLYVKYVLLRIRLKKKKMYNKAVERSRLESKPLMVIGNPSNGHMINRLVMDNIFGMAYGYGDICIDLSGCAKAETSIKGKLEDVLYQFDTNSHVIFISQTLEYIDSHKIDTVLKELIRISGGDIYNVFMDYDSPSYKDEHGEFTLVNRFNKSPPFDDCFEYKTHLDNFTHVHKVTLPTRTKMQKIG